MEFINNLYACIAYRCRGLIGLFEEVIALFGLNGFIKKFVCTTYLPF
jgi:hypothetical protein